MDVSFSFQDTSFSNLQSIYPSITIHRSCYCKQLLLVFKIFPFKLFYRLIIYPYFKSSSRCVYHISSSHFISTVIFYNSHLYFNCCDYMQRCQSDAKLTTHICIMSELDLFLDYYYSYQKNAPLVESYYFLYDLRLLSKT